MKITGIAAYEIFDSRGYPTIECQITLENGRTVHASVPSGVSCGKYEAHELRDKAKRLRGYGVSKAIENIETIIAPEILGKVPNVVEMDMKMIEQDGTEHKSKLGANAMLATSIAITKAQAVVNDMHIYELIAQLCGFELVSIPYPLINVINGGMHADNNLQVQEIMIVPVGFSSFRKAFEASTDVFYNLKETLRIHKKQTCVGDEGGFAAQFDDETEAFDLLTETVEKSKISDDGEFTIALDVAASQFYDKKTKTYCWHKKELTTAQMINMYEKWTTSYPIFSIEDGVDEDDLEGWQSMMEKISDRVQVVADDLYASNPARIAAGLEHMLANAVIIKPNQIGTVTETIQSVLLCKDDDVDVVISHRSGETEDTFIVDLAVGISAEQIKIGGPSRGERICKYNQMLRIEDELHLAVMNE